jgi:hypothetical protein
METLFSTLFYTLSPAGLLVVATFLGPTGEAGPIVLCVSLFDKGSSLTRAQF